MFLHIPPTWPSHKEYANLKARIEPIPLVAGIFEKKEDAMRLLAKVLKTNQKTLEVKPQLDIGCLHQVLSL